MTREEAIKIFTGYMGGKIDPESTELYHAIELAVDILESQPSLPSNIDEAALDAAQLDMCDRQIMEASNDERLRYSRIFRRGFKAGAEWRERQVPKLPSNLDEAAEKNFETMEVLEYENIFEETHRKIFKAGAQWMAGQGETLDSLIWRDEDDKLFIEAFVDENKFKMADNVIIQIRKK